MRVLLLGGSGQLGAEIRRRWSGCEIDAPPHAALDAGDRAALERALDERRFDLLVNCAAFHNVDLCEDEPGRAFALNAIAVGDMAAACMARGVRFATISTDYVFSGDTSKPYTEDDVPAPVSVYGTSKLAGEFLARERDPDALVVRTCGIYGLRPSATKGYTFIDRVIAQAKAGERVRIVSDVTASPTYAGHLAEALRALVAREASGVWHVVNPGPVTWYDFARYALAAAGIEHPVEPVPQSTWPTKARRPRYSALASERLAAAGIDMPGWRAGIEAYLRDKAALEAGA